MNRILLTTALVFLFVLQGFGYTIQGHYRWRNDDGSESTATWKAADNTIATAERNTNVRLRLELIEDSQDDNKNLSLFYGTKTDSINETWKKITTDGTTNHFILSNTDNYAQHDVAHDLLPDTPGYPYNWGFCNELNTANDYNITVDTGMEVEFCLQPTDNAQLDTVYYFCMRFSGTAVAIDGYQHYPKLTVLENSLPVELSAFTAQAHGSQVLLAWTTETETENLGFILQRKTTGQDPWREVASYRTDRRLQGQGTITTQTRYSFTDTPGKQGELQYRLANINTNGTVEWHQAINVNVEQSLPQNFSLEPAYPNPFNPGTNIRYQLAKDTQVELSVYDLLGRRVRSLVNSLPQNAGVYQITWDGTGDSGEKLSSGIYFILLQTAEQRFMQRVTLVK